MACPKCGIDPTGCLCAAEGSDCFNVVGDGSEGSPYTVAPVINDNSQDVLRCGVDGFLAQLPTELVQPPSAQMFATLPQALTPGGGVGTIAFDSVRFDNDGLADLSNNRFVIQTAGVYVITLLTGYSPETTVNRTIQPRIHINGSIFGIQQSRRQDVTPPKATFIPFTIQEELSQGDLVTAHSNVGAGNALSLLINRASPVFSVLWKRGPTP